MKVSPSETVRDDEVIFDDEENNSVVIADSDDEDDIEHFNVPQVTSLTDQENVTDSTHPSIEAQTGNLGLSRDDNDEEEEEVYDNLQSNASEA